MAQTAAQVMEGSNGVEFCASLDQFAQGVTEWNGGTRTPEILFGFYEKLASRMRELGMDVPEPILPPVS